MSAAANPSPSPSPSSSPPASQFVPKLDAKEQAKMNAMMSNLRDNQKATVVSGEQGVSRTLELPSGLTSSTSSSSSAEAGESGGLDLKSIHTVYFKNCRSSHYTVTERVTKVFVDDCHDCSFTFHKQFLTQVLEAWKCSNIVLHTLEQIKTYQLDLSDGITIRVPSPNQAPGMCVWNHVENLKIEFTDSPVWTTTVHEETEVTSNNTLTTTANAPILPSTTSASSTNTTTTTSTSTSTSSTTTSTARSETVTYTVPPLSTGFAQMAALYPDSNKTIDQFIIRLNGHTGKWREERCIRLQNGFLSTEREAVEWEKKNELLKARFVENFLKEGGIRVNRKPEKKIPPNDPCPCGSKLKYKKCCANKKVLTGVAGEVSATVA